MKIYAKGDKIVVNIPIPGLDIKITEHMTVHHDNGGTVYSVPDFRAVAGNDLYLVKREWIMS